MVLPDYGHELTFGVFVTPSAKDPEVTVALAAFAEQVGFDLVTFQDHPYLPTFLDTWTLLSYVAARTERVALSANVLNLPLRGPAVIARSVASLDLLSGGRVELGLGAGAFWDGIEAMGGRRLTPGQAVDALSEAIDVIRALWNAEGRGVRYDGRYHRLLGAKPGPAPAHAIEIWLGAYKPRMLRLTGTKADGWLPSMGYLELEQLPDMNARIDESAADAGRRPEEIRRMLNINGGFGEGGGFLQGPPRAWAEQLAELTLATGMSTYILAVTSADDLRRFAEEVAPATRELVADARGRPGQEPVAVPVVLETPGPAAAPLAARPTPDPDKRLSDQQAWDETTRPSGQALDPSRTYTPQEQAAGQHLIDVHDALRGELAQLRDLVER